MIPQQGVQLVVGNTESGEPSEHAEDTIINGETEPPSPPSTTLASSFDSDWMSPGNRYRLDDIFDTESDINETQSDHWSVPWSDLMMVMFVLFAALLTAQALEKTETVPVEKKVPAANNENAPNFESLMRVNVFERSKQAVRETNIQNVQIVAMEDQSVKVSVRGPMFFALGKADLRQDMRNFLRRLAQIINQTPYQVNVVGHTDDHPINTNQFPSNWELSVTRAARAARYLIDEGGVNPKRFTVMGRSHYDPVAKGTNMKARAKNRRVEIIITRDIENRDPGEQL